MLKHRRTKPDTCGAKEYAEVKKIAPRPMTKNLAIPTLITKNRKGKNRKVSDKKQEEENLDLESVEEIGTETITLMSTTLVSFVDATEEDEKSEIQITFVEEDVLGAEDSEPLIKLETDTNPFSSFINIEDTSLTCQMCPKIYKSVKVIHNHLRKEHQVDLDDAILKQIRSSLKTLPTKKSDHSFDRPPQPTPLLDDSQTSPKKSHTCLKCSRTFSSKTILSDHERSNCGSKPVYVCDICHKGYHSAGSLKTHKTMHTGELNHVCPYCGQTFRTAGQVKIHSRKHTGEKPYSCKKCDKSFGHRESLLTHESVHTGVKRFMCKCGQRFSCISNLKAHRKSHKNKCGKFPLVTKPVVEGICVNKKQFNK